MKKQKFLFGALTALAMGAAFTACSDDPIDNGTNKVAEVDQTRYLHVTIANPTNTGSRAEAGNFEAGTAQENYVHEVFFVFYDALGTPTGESYSLSFTDNKNNDDGTNNTDKGPIEGEFNPSGDDNNPNANTGNVGKVWTSVIPVSLKQGDNLPSYVMAFINPINSSGLVTKTLAQLDEEQRDRSRCTDNHFPMSNSVYYANNPISGETNARMVATPVVTSQLATSIEDAKNATAVKIYVERYASKVNLTLPATEGTITDYSAINGGYKLTFVPEYWRPNAIDNQTYVVKRYGLIQNDVENYQPTYAELLTNFDNLTWWNDAPNFRSYWAATPSYYENVYPSVSDDVTDQPDGTYSLHYFSYNEISTSKINNVDTPQPSIEDVDGGFSGAFYARETTTYSGAWKKSEGERNYNPLATIPSAVIVGRYVVTKNDGSKLPNNSTFFLYGKTGNNWNLYETETEVKTAMAKQQNVVLKNVGTAEKPNYQPVRIGTVGTDKPTNVDESTFKVEHPSKDVRTAANVKVAGRLVALQLPTENVPTGLVWYNPTPAEGQSNYEAITATNVNNVNEALLTAGYATRYGDGLCYFNIPIEHLGIRASVSATNTGDYVTGAKNTNGTYNFNNCPAGSFGLVRNHVYNINVQSISGLATALYDENQPIVPPVDEVSYYISAELNVLNWRIVPVQNVIL